jgi:FkbM family methyltransferase
MTASLTTPMSTAQSPQVFSGWLNRLFVLLQCKEWRGKHRFYLWCVKHIGHRLIAHNIDDRQFVVPLGEWCFWLEKGPENYYLDEFLPFCDMINETHQPFSFFDLGADIGTVSSLVAANCPLVTSVCAFEPNIKSFSILEYNLANIIDNNHAVCAAVSNFNGSVAFRADPDRLNDHEGYISVEITGDTPVTTVDTWVLNNQLKLSPLVVIKIDVEGQEAQAIEGALDLIRNADTVILLLEIHPEILNKNGQTPEDLFACAEQIRQIEWTVPLLNNCKVDRHIPFFKQVPLSQYDVIGTTTRLQNV